MSLYVINFCSPRLGDPELYSILIHIHQQHTIYKGETYKLDNDQRSEGPFWVTDEKEFVPGRKVTKFTCYLCYVTRQKRRIVIRDPVSQCLSSMVSKCKSTATAVAASSHSYRHPDKSITQKNETGRFIP